VQHADLRPGTLLLALAIEQAAREGVQTIDMLRGDEDYKKLWGAVWEATYGFERSRCEEAIAATSRLESAA
jgi:CelD/BcsL family acetyltransferase involved in cellulose biosynthesis